MLIRSFFLLESEWSITPRLSCSRSDQHTSHPFRSVVSSFSLISLYPLGNVSTYWVGKIFRSSTLVITTNPPSGVRLFKVAMKGSRWKTELSVPGCEVRSVAGNGTSKDLRTSSFQLWKGRRGSSKLLYRFVNYERSLNTSYRENYCRRKNKICP